MKTTKQYGKKIDTALSTWVKLTRAFHTVAQLSAEDIRSYGLTQPQFGVLESICHLGPMCPGSISKKQLVSGGNMTVVVDNLEKEGLVERVSCAEDRRQTFIHLTKKGEELIKMIFVKHAQYMTELFSVLSEEEQLELSVLLKKLGKSLENKQ